MKNLKKILFILPVAMLLSAAVTFAMNGNMDFSKSSDVELALEKNCDNCDKKDCKGKKSCTKAEKAKCAKGKKACCSSKKAEGKTKSEKKDNKKKSTDG